VAKQADDYVIIFLLKRRLAVNYSKITVEPTCLSHLIIEALCDPALTSVLVWGINLSLVNVIVDDLTTFEHVCTRISTGQFSAIVVVVY